MAVITKYYKDVATGEADSTNVSTLQTGYVGDQIVAIRNEFSYVKVCVDDFYPNGAEALLFWDTQLNMPENTLEEITEEEFQTATGL